MKRPYRARYIAYRKYRSEIWGDLINKGKFIKISKFLLKIFNLQLKILFRNQSIKKDRVLIDENRQLFNTQLSFSDSTYSTSSDNFINNAFTTFIDKDYLILKQNNFFVLSYTSKNINFFEITRKLITESFWMNLRDLDSTYNSTKITSKNKNSDTLDYLYLTLNNKFLPKTPDNSKKMNYKSVPFETRFTSILTENYNSKTNKNFLFSHWFEENANLFLKMNAVRRNLWFKPAFKEFRKKRSFKKERFRNARRYYKITQGNRDAYKMTTWLPLKRRFNISKWSKWWKSRIEQKKLALFYGIISIKKFKFFNSVTFTSQKLHAYSALALEMMVCTILFRTNLFTNMYAITSFIRLGGCLLNNKKIIYPFFRMKLNDIISIDKKYFKKLLNGFYLRARTNYLMNVNPNNKALNRPTLIVNVPNYLFANYKILHFKIIILPKRSDIMSPLAPAFFGKGYDWSISTKSSY